MKMIKGFEGLKEAGRGLLSVIFMYPP